MASIIWTTVWWFLMVELVIVLILVIPVPRKVRNALARPVSRLRLGDRFSKIGLFVTIGLTFALIESISSIQALQERQKLEHELDHAGIGGGGTEHDRIFHDLDRQRKFRAERNMYLAAFSLTLQFVIMRLCQLMQESVESDEEIKRLTTAIASEGASTDDDDSKKKGGVEMTMLGKKKNSQDKKKD
mmetsp:Transcript_11394/g.17488  ORF Transcript_11394/g.17488 Transcript_11394/m.17488 type:complete len:187 (+) Transcript_11394:133-693(+)